MKRVNSSKFFILFLVLICAILSFVSLNNNNSYGVLEDNNYVNKNKVSDEVMFDFLKDSQAIMEIYDLSPEMGNIILNAPEIVKEDPSLAIKKNEAIKGVAKQTTAKKEVEKYETNETSLGIDVSTWQGTINWKKVKESGINFAMIRCGFRGMESGEITMDARFLDNIKGATANNINVGVYFFSMAKDEKEAIEEAKWVVNLIKDYDISYPVAVDTEIFDKYRLKGVSYSDLTNNAIAFSNYVKKQGYTPMIYSYLRAFNNYFDTAKFDPYRIWLAQYNDEATYKGRYYMWQYTSSGSVPGITGRVDMDVSYFSVTNDATKRSVVNGVYKTSDMEDVEFKETNIKTTLVKNSSLRISPYTTLPNKAGSLDKGTSVIVTGLGRNWVRIEYGGNTYYINDTKCFDLILEDVNFEKVDLTVKINKDVQLLYKPYTFLFDNEDRVLSEGEEVRIVGVNDLFTKIMIEDTLYYIYDVDFYDVIRDNAYLGSKGSKS